MRAVGHLRGLGDLGPHDHCCWRFEGGDDLRAAAAEFLEHGLSLGLRLCYAGPRPADELREELASLPDRDALIVDGVLTITSLAEIYGAGSEEWTVDPAGQVAAYAAASDDAVEQGFNGLRVAADATELVRSPEQRDQFLRYEHLIDRYMTSRPFSAMCAYDAGELGAETVLQLECAHPVAGTGAGTESVPFHVFARDLHVLGLAGEIDAMWESLLTDVLAAVAPEPVEGAELDLDLSELAFIDHTGLVQLDRYAQRAGSVLRLHTDLPTVPRMVELLDLHRLRVEPLATRCSGSAAS